MEGKMAKKVWGFLRETVEKAIHDDIHHPDITGLKRTGLEEYLKVIFPNTNDWIHNKALGKGYKIRPDYRSDSLKLIIEFDGLQHYTNPKNIEKDDKNTKIYKSCGYKVVRIPYFIQLTNKAVEQMFGVKVKEPLFDGKIPSLSISNSPAFLCPAGLQRMAEEFAKFPEQYEVNRQALEKAGNPYLSGVELLEKAVNEIMGK
ncbi:DUF559 domain-containing protein [bacterium]|nr:DUF559 domain-containing protein [bacterium]